MRWGDDDELMVGETRLLTLGARDGIVDAAALFRISLMKSNEQRLVILKTRRMIEDYLRILWDLRPRRVLELGIFQGGSIALIDEAVGPDKIVAIDLASEPVPALEDWIRARDLSQRVTTFYGVDQSDAATLDSIIDQEFDGPLDLIIDDASHLMPQSRESFCSLFPRLRPGGAYIVEDWSWAHRTDLTGLNALDESVPLTLLLFELTVACAHVPGVIERIEVRPDLFTVRRGTSPLDSKIFPLSEFLDEKARSLVPRLGA